jgi:ribosomal protein S13
LTTKKHLSSRKKILTNKEIEEINKKVEDNRRITGPKITIMIQNEMEREISSKIAKRYAVLDGLRLRISRKVPLISKKNQNLGWNSPKSSF